ncbi:hypothetical protein [Staphylococcus coagulans]|uniref:hypothetical protein n=1 Tax=Staphylococcus coagulans TaxID=74706 RepID=UPI00067A3650|nr:hypothetical protein [Staphylococcus coagulans]AKS68174.1 hypothetical protein NP71_00680 [Staphylococcus schleiferi]AKS70403.1 hypothetical protein OA96_00570 [Staphylococcus schleiferi]MBA8764355.1 hypothetical protein [Staphylococcus coagulans]MBT2809815.1 hypothetical protein [Staphylococcus coagulans]MBT2811957.1 hypothetical protein [Staphylococcus coagulans]
MKKIYNIITTVLILISLTIIMTSIFVHNEQYQTMINTALFILVIFIGIFAITVRIIHDKTKK